MDATVLLDPVVRVKAMENNFMLFFAYHFGRSFTNFQKDWMKSMQSEQNTYIVAFRASRKTTIARGFVVWCICYKKHPSIVRQSFEQTLSAESVREIAKMLCKDSIVRDYGLLFPFETKRDDLAKKSLSNFETTNGVKVASKALWQTLRGANTYDIREERSARPTLLVLDDIDVADSVSNVDVINRNEHKILSETIGALDPLNRKIIFLWNVIAEDGIVPRFWNNYNGNEKRDCFKQPLINSRWENVRPEVFTDDVIAQLKADGKTSRNQNYLLIPSNVWWGIFTKDYFDYFLLSHFEEVDSPLKKNDVKCAFFVDPAFSSSDISDDACVVLLGEHVQSRQVFVIDWYADTSAPSKTIQAIIVMYNKALHMWFEPKFISVEHVQINRAQVKFLEDLKAALTENMINIPVYPYMSRINKNTRIKDNLEGIMSQKGVKFNRNISDPTFIPKLERQFLEYPNGNHDDIIDTVSQGVEVFRKQHPKQPTVKKNWEEVHIDLVTRKTNETRGLQISGWRGRISLQTR